MSLEWQKHREYMDDQLIKQEDNIIKALDKSILDCHNTLKQSCKQIENILKDDYQKLAIMNQKHNLVKSQQSAAVYTENKRHDRFLKIKFKKIEERNLSDMRKYDKSGFGNKLAGKILTQNN